MSAGPGRVEAIDQYRGIAVILMVIANYLADIVTIPPWLKHTPDIGLTPTDLIAPFFIFAMALTYGHSYRRRVGQDGTGRTWGHFLRRFLAIIGIGAVISAGEGLVGENTSGISWGVLQAIGAAGILTLPVLALGPLWRALVGLLLLGLYQALLGAFWLPMVLHSPHGGLQGSLSWGAMLILATAVSDLWHARTGGKRWFASASLAALAAGIALAFLVPVSKNRVSASYVLISMGASGLLFVAVWLLVERLRFRPAFLRWWGANPLLLYVMHYLLLAIFVLPGVSWWHANASTGLVVAQAAFIVGALSVFAWLLARRDRRVSL